MNNELSIIPLYHANYREKYLLKFYPNGAILLLLQEGNSLEIIGQADYIEELDIEDPLVQQKLLDAYLQATEEKQELTIDDVIFKKIPPVERNSYSLHSAIPLPEKDFYYDQDHNMFRIYQACRTRYDDCTPETFKFIIYQNPKERNNVLYLGYAIDIPDLTNLEKLLGPNVLVITFDAFCETRDERINKKQKQHLTKDDVFQKDEESKKAPILAQIKDWLNNTTYENFCNAINKRILGQPNLKLILVSIYNYLYNLANGNNYRSNILLAAPSGSGKTETYRALKSYFSQNISRVPVLQIDVTTFTESGYRGRNTDEIMNIIAEQNTSGIAIVFFDEFDKKMIPSIGSTGLDYNAAFQSELLTLIEGSIITNKSGTPLFDSSNTMFIGLGSFDHTRKQKEEEAKHNSIGFLTKPPIQEYEHFSDITITDVINQGASYELLGRFSLLINYYKLPPDVVSQVIDNILNQLTNTLSVKIKLSSQMREYLLSEANSKYGCRRLRSIIEEAVYPIYHQILLNNEPKELCIIIVKNQNNAGYKKGNITYEPY